MSLTSIADQRTPGRPSEITFGPDLGLPSANQELCLIGHLNGSTGSVAPYTVASISAVSDPVAALTEATTKFGADAEITKMILAAVKANQGGSTFPAIKAVALLTGDTDFGSALTAVGRTKAEFVVSPYNGMSTANRDLLKAAVIAMSGAQRGANNQFGSFGVVAEQATVDPTSLDEPDTLSLIPIYNRNSAPAYTVGETAAAAAAVLAAQGAPFNPVDSLTIQNLAAPTAESDRLTVGSGLESETVLQKGWTPLFVKPNGEVAFVRAITARISADGTGTPVVTSYFDVQDFQVLYFFRKTLVTRFSQPDFKQRKASANTAQDVKAETIRLMQAFQDQGMFQAVDQLGKLVRVERSATDRSRLDLYVPINVIPGLHVVASNINAGVQFDVVSI